jgi:hypothetical protein
LTALTSAIPRHDPYRHIHKGLRTAMLDTLQRLGCADTDDAAELHAALDQADSLLQFMAAHVKHENDHLHPAIEARHPGAARQTADEHASHLASLASLHAQVAALRGAAPEHRGGLAHGLYLALSRLVAENLDHMLVEETHNNHQLWSLYSDEEVIAIHDRLLAAVEPAVMMEAIGWMARGLSVPELGELLRELQRKAPPPAFDAALAQVRRQMDPVRWSALQRLLEAALAA